MSFFYEDTAFDIDTRFDQLFINNTEQRPFRPSMSKTKWLSLSKEEQEMWDKFIPKLKGIILDIMQPCNPATQINTNEESVSVTLISAVVLSLS